MKRNINPTSTWHYMHFVVFLIYESKEGADSKTKRHRMVPPATEARVGVFVVNVVWRSDVSRGECLVTFYECIREDKCHFHLFFAINTKLTYLFSGFLHLCCGPLTSSSKLKKKQTKNCRIPCCIGKIYLTNKQSLQLFPFPFSSCATCFLL